MGRRRRRQEGLSESLGAGGVGQQGRDSSVRKLRLGDPLGELTAETERLGIAFEGAPLGIVIKDARGTLLRAATLPSGGCSATKRVSFGV